MPLIIPESKQEKVAIKINIFATLLDEIRDYYRYTGIHLDQEFDGFFEQAAFYVLKKDKEFEKWKKSNRKK